MIQDGIKSYMATKQFDLSKIPSHVHNGTDTNKINQKDIIPSQKFTAFLVTTLTGAGTEIDTINNIPNFTRIDFNGFAANNAGGGAATKRAIITGLAVTGNCVAYYSNGTSTGTSPVPIIMASNALYVDSTDLTKAQVSAANIYLCYAVDNTGAVIVSTTVSFTSSTITFTTTVASGWKLQGSLVIS